MRTHRRKAWRSRISERWRAETPVMWQRARNISASIGVVSTAILTAETAVGVGIDDFYRKLLAWGVAIGAGVAAFSQMQRHPPEK